MGEGCLLLPTKDLRCLRLQPSVLRRKGGGGGHVTSTVCACCAGASPSPAEGSLYAVGPQPSNFGYPSSAVYHFWSSALPT